VGDAWERASDKASSMYWTFRVGYIHQTRVFGILRKKAKNCLVDLTRLTDWIDNRPDIRFTDEVIWEKVWRHLKYEEYQIPSCLLLALYLILNDLSLPCNQRVSTLKSQLEKNTQIQGTFLQKKLQTK